MAKNHRAWQRVPYVVAVAAIALVVGGGCGRKRDKRWDALVSRLTDQRGFHPPESSSTDSVGYFPALYVRAAGDSIEGFVNPNPEAPVDGATDVTPMDMVQMFRATRVGLQKRLPPGVQLPHHANLVLDRGMDFSQVMQAIYVTTGGSFQMPHLVTAEGHDQFIEPPRVDQRYGAVGWSAWVWWTPDDTLRWSVYPDTSEGFVVRHVPPVDGEANLAALHDTMNVVLNSRSYLPPPDERLIGIWAYGKLPYPDLMKLMDTIRYPTKGQRLAGRITLLEGEPFGPPDVPIRADSAATAP